MNRHRCYGILAGLMLAVPAAWLGAQPPLPKAGPEMEVLKKMVGTWDASIKMADSPGESRGTMTCAIELGGLWLVSRFQGDFGGLAFSGKGLDSFDQAKKKYTGIWVDSMSTTPMILEGQYDAARKQMVMYGDAPGFDGKPAKHKLVTTFLDQNNLAWSMAIVDPQGKEKETMTIRYKKK